MKQQLNKIHVINFQSHTNSTLELVDGVNVIIGKSDSGKTGIFRCFNWVAENRPLGDAFRSEWGGETKGALVFDESTVHRIKSEKENKYALPNKVELKAFGSEPPQEVKDIVRMDSINIQQQVDPPFLLSNSPGEAAQVLNKAASIQDIDFLISNLKRGYNRTNRDIKQNENRIGNLNEQLKNYENLPKIERLIAIAEKTTKEIEDLKDQKRRLLSITNSMYVIENELKQTENLQEVEDLLSKAEEIKNDLEKAREIKRKLETFIYEIKVTSKNIANIDKKIKEFEEEYNELVPDECPLCGNEMR
jgi:DNA repair exonuclease SbcCD ATPase subunit